MRSSYAAAAAVLLLAGGAALAGEMTLPGNNHPVTATPDAARAPPGAARANDLQVGVGVICNTQQQAANYVRLRARGTETSMAMNSVNQQSKDPKACGVAAIAYKRGKTMESTSLNGRVVDIVRVDVLAGYDGHGWARVRQMTQYAVVETKGIAI